jgi:heavy metal sensor kinase
MIIKTYRMRLTLVFTAFFGLLFFLFSLAAYNQYKQNLRQTADWWLLRSAKAAAEAKVGASMLERDQDIFTREGDNYTYISLRGNRIVAGSLGAASQRWPVDMEKLQKAFTGILIYDTVQYKGEKFRVLYYPVGSKEVLRTVASLDDIERHLAGLRRTAVFFPAFIVGILFLGSWFLAGAAVAPVSGLTRRAEEIIKDKTAEKIDIGAKGKEIDGLTKVLNSLIENVHASGEAHKRFTSDVAHEIRSPLTSLIGNTEVALRKRRGTEEYEELLRNNLADMVRLSRITDNILFLSKADNQILDLRKQRFDLNLFLRNVVDRFRFKAERSEVILNEHYWAQPIELFGDMNLLEQAISNLIDNAIKYTPRGGEVTVISSREDPEIKVTISDNGIGIPEEEIPYIFDRFYRGEKEHARSAGTGLGLAITQWIISANNGKIYVKSKVGTGSDFVVVFQPEEQRR